MLQIDFFLVEERIETRRETMRSSTRKEGFLYEQEPEYLFCFT